MDIKLRQSTGMERFAARARAGELPLDLLVYLGDPYACAFLGKDPPVLGKSWAKGLESFGRRAMVQAAVAIGKRRIECGLLWRPWTGLYYRVGVLIGRAWLSDGLGSFRGDRGVTYLVREIHGGRYLLCVSWHALMGGINNLMGHGFGGLIAKEVMRDY